jgi:hypothetical protein
MNLFIRRAAKKCMMAPDPWVPLLGPLLGEDKDLPEELVHTHRRDRADALIKAAALSMRNLREKVAVIDQFQGKAMVTSSFPPSGPESPPSGPESTPSGPESTPSGPESTSRRVTLI